MKVSIGKVVFSVLLASVAFSASAKPNEFQKWENSVIAGQQNGDLTVAIGPARKVVGKRRDVPISVAKPTQGA